MAKETIVVGSKNFTESYILAEIIAQTIEDAGELNVERKFGLAGTGIVFAALENAEIDIYPEYTGTISRFLLKKPELYSIEQINNALEKKNLIISESLGFNNTYALAVKEKIAQKKQLNSISDLTNTSLHAGFSHEFIKRDDGLKGLLGSYHLKFKRVQGFEHALLYNAIKNDEVDIIEVYSTDGKIPSYKLRILDDDRFFFPQYYSVLFYRKKLLSYPETMKALKNLQGQFSEEKMQKLNAMADIEKKSFKQIADIYLDKNVQKTSSDKRAINKLLKLTYEHLYLVIISLCFSIIIGIPLGFLAYQYKKLGQVILIVTGLLQTIPSLALLCFLLPLFGIGTLPSLVALFLYGLLPIVRNTYTGFATLPKSLLESAQVLGLNFRQRLIFIQLPMISREILSGVKTTAVINVGMTTLAAFIGAGGYGTQIVTGLALNDNSIILQGAIPAAIMSIFVHFFFEFIEKMIVPKGLQT